MNLILWSFGNESVFSHENSFCNTLWRYAASTASVVEVVVTTARLEDNNKPDLSNRFLLSSAGTVLFEPSESLDRH